jgi:hypothetical protein
VDYPSVDDYITPLFTNGSPLNYARYDNAVVEEAMLAARQILDSGKRATAEAAIVKMIGDDCPNVPIATYAHERVTSARVHGLVFSPLFMLDFVNCWIEPTGGSTTSGVSDRLAEPGSGLAVVALAREEAEGCPAGCPVAFLRSGWLGLDGQC